MTVMTIMTVKPREWGVGSHYCRLWRCHSMLYERHMVWKPLLGGIAYFKHKLREKVETTAVRSCGSFCSGKCLKNPILLLGDYCFLVCSLGLIVFAASEGSSCVTAAMAKAVFFLSFSI